MHTYIGDLVVTLIAPDGSTYVAAQPRRRQHRQHRPTYTSTCPPKRPMGPGSCVSRTPQRPTSAASTPGPSTSARAEPTPSPSPSPSPSPTATPTPPVPDTTITSGPSGATNGTAPSFAFTASVAGSTFECKLDTPARRGQLRGVHVAAGYTTTAERRVHVLGARDRSGGTVRAGDALVHGRHGRARDVDRLGSGRLDDRRRADVHVLVERAGLVLSAGWTRWRRRASSSRVRRR